ncbi:putative RNase H-like HicB family nuclease [Streptosporangium album]|uniref:Putative RNase H-like HicB family nuclease n=1 Tax=Streptosporangium album TaxID=47479 RepID=A0A7W7RWV1_9ACTN|nr:hypothetical protein [Streptosporangium album]MBB4939397.1 putative RNase H-like HicB family nuclease [Streptosporangium album]
MTAETIHLIIRAGENDLDLYATSPQAPGLIYGRKTYKELRADLESVLSFHFERPGPFNVIEHNERHYGQLGSEDELVTRLAIDEHRDERQEVYTRIGRALGIPSQAKSLTAAPTNAVGETVFLCAVFTDTIEWVLSQLDPGGDVINVAVATADELLVTIPFAYAAEVEGTVSMKKKAYAMNTTMAEIVRDIEIEHSSADLRPVFVETKVLAVH